MPGSPPPSTAALLIESKLVPPQLEARLLARPRLSTLLQAGLTRRLVSLTAPAGYGKTTALAQLVAQLEPLGAPSAWLSLDAEDNDPLHFMRYLAAALQRADASLGRAALAQMDSGTMVSLDAVVASLLHELIGHPRRLLVVLDDFHLVQADDVHRKLEWLMSHLPAHIGFVIASRRQLPFALAQMRLRGELLELDTAHFSLGLDETADFVDRVSGSVLDRAQLQTLHERTEGWIAGLQLASLALRESHDKGAFLAAFSGTDRDITDYLGEQVLSSLRPELREFLLDTAPLNRFCAELCDEVLERNDSRAMLAEVQARQLFLSELDRSRTWFRYHHLFADYLRERGRERAAAHLQRICLRASAWFDRRRLPHEAVRYAFEAQDLERAADLVAAFSAELVQYRGEHATLLAWLARLPQALVQARPHIRTGHAWSLVLTRRHAEADAELRALESLGADAQDDDGAVRCVVEMIRCVYYALSDQPLRAKAAGEAWLHHWPQAEAFRTGVVANVVAAGCCATDEFEAGMRALAIARRAFEECGAHYGLAWASALATLIAMRRGDFVQALEHARQGMATVEASLGVASYAGSMLTLLAAEVCYELNELGQARHYLDLGLPFIDEHGLVEMSTAGYLTRARLLRLAGDTAGADACLLEGESLGHRLRLPRLARILAAERCALRLAIGAGTDAQRLARSYGFMEGEASGLGPAPRRADDPEPPAEGSVDLLRLRLRLARAQGAQGTDGLAPLLADAVRRAQRQGHQAQLARLLALRALHQHRGLDRAQALRTLQEALALGARGGLLRSLVDLDPQLMDLVDALIAARPARAGGPSDTQPVPLAYLQQLLQAAGRAATAAVPAAHPKADSAPAVELTERELKVLRLLQAGLGNREVAQSLFLSEATVKWHLHNIFAKLGVKNRTGALARAQQISLL
ncbi:LuxR C-terminal-related transcriptional regulator [Xenophilus arseniciresistens]|uniref:LuxR C-terminal-related transcriptional regulator n=1 Tax=Xenophilus arseniciresistens TaxID=1283306 RepID=A0AAE3N630_9BURK|nr:LuxR C-terminal-related transcriptional regulator [Xenophilus arseniciresistens]MDA7416260.1 LuxR C-terminal-related transcriptional regulator [Xenophilus arseniciresistens]